jgi:hypothetical protein
MENDESNSAKIFLYIFVAGLAFLIGLLYTPTAQEREFIYKRRIIERKEIVIGTNDKMIPTFIFKDTSLVVSPQDYKRFESKKEILIVFDRDGTIVKLDTLAN